MFANCVQVTVVKRKCEHLLACLAQQNTLSGLPLWCIQGNFILNFFPSKILNYFFDQFNTLVPGTFCSVPIRLLLLPVSPQSLAFPNQLQGAKPWAGAISITSIDSPSRRASSDSQIPASAALHALSHHNPVSWQICTYSWTAQSLLDVSTVVWMEQSPL